MITRTRCARGLPWATALARLLPDGLANVIGNVLPFGELALAALLLVRDVALLLLAALVASLRHSRWSLDSALDRQATKEDR